MPPTRVLDTGPIVAIIQASGEHHQACVAALPGMALPMLTTWPVLTEVVYLLGETSSSVAQLFSMIRRGDLTVVPLGVADLNGIEAVIAKYSDQKLGLADATLMYLAERDGISHVFTLDRRHFSVFRKQSGGYLSLLPL